MCLVEWESHRNSRCHFDSCQDIQDFSECCLQLDHKLIKQNNLKFKHRSYNSLHLARKYARIFVRGHYLFRVKKNCELRGTDNVQGQISEHIFAPNGGYCLYYPSNLLRNARSFENWGISSDISQF